VERGALFSEGASPEKLLTLVSSAKSETGRIIACTIDPLFYLRDKVDFEPLLQSIGKDKSDDQQSGWNVDNFMQVAKELVSFKKIFQIFYYMYSI